VLATAYDWHWVYYVWILLEVGLVALVWSCIPSTDAPSTASAPISVATVKEVFSDRTLLCFLLPFVAHSVCAFSALTMNPLFMVEVYRLDVTQTATVYGVTRFFGLFGSFIGGVLSDRFAKIKLLLAVSINLFFPTIYAVLVGLTSSSTRGKAQGLYNSVAFTIGGVAPYIMGVITDVSSFQQAFMFPLLIAVIGILWLSVLLLKGHSQQTG
jgi:MFS-type transporter involved in bile tolerance (Atg22 family)